MLVPCQWGAARRPGGPRPGWELPPARRWLVLGHPGSCHHRSSAVNLQNARKPWRAPCRECHGVHLPAGPPGLLASAGVLGVAFGLLVLRMGGGDSEGRVFPGWCGAEGEVPQKHRGVCGSRGPGPCLLAPWLGWARGALRSWTSPGGEGSRSRRGRLQGPWACRAAAVLQ